MLYDILPPLIFFGSLAGILVIVSRVIIRMRRDKMHSEVKAQGRQNQSVKKINTILKPSAKSVQAVGSRAAASALAVKQTATGFRQSWKDRKKAKQQRVATEIPAPESDKTIAAPPVGFRDKVQERAGGLINSAKNALSGFGARARGAAQAIQERRAAKKEAAVQTSPEPILEPTNQVAAGPKTYPKAELPPIPKPAPKPAVTSAGMNKLKARLTSRPKIKKESAIKKAEAALKAEKPEKAEELIVPYIIEHPKDTHAYMVLGQASLAVEAYSEAVEVFDQVIKLAPETPDAYRLLGQCLKKTGKYGRAVLALQKAHEAEPTNTEILQDLVDLAKRTDNKTLSESFALKLRSLQEAKQISTR